ncbi:MAG: hypothetical protein GXZ08_05800 [Tissierellia bacterium]|nr:hypothetical protein [Tissierellia bacterium]
MRYITKITRRDIFDLFELGVEEESYFTKEKVFYPYYGRLDEIEFLNRLYDLKSMESYDSRFDNAEGDIWQHTISNDDYPCNWVFKDDRFQLLYVDDNIFLRFICEIFHPEVRDESAKWKLFFEEINYLLNQDGYELHAFRKISGREVYSWRKYIEEPSFFIPFSQRRKDLIKNNKLQVKLSKNIRHQIYQLLNSYDEALYFTTETNWNYTRLISELVFDDIKQFYKPMNYDNNKYVESTSFEKFVKNTSPLSVLDVIESFYLHVSAKEEYQDKVNAIFELHDIKITLKEGKISLFLNTDIIIDPMIPVKEVGIEELLIDAEKFYENKNYSIAVEKMWDAFERIKTYYSPTLDKKQSANKIIYQLSDANNSMSIIFEEEFRTLTKIGNDFRIRHHEKNKIEIYNDIHYEYFYKRCLTLITTILKIL